MTTSDVIATVTKHAIEEPFMKHSTDLISKLHHRFSQEVIPLSSQRNTGLAIRPLACHEPIFKCGRVFNPMDLT